MIRYCWLYWGGREGRNQEGRKRTRDRRTEEGRKESKILFVSYHVLL